jgi:hypothetical protein
MPHNRIDDLHMSYPCRILNLGRLTSVFLIADDPSNACGRNAHARLAAQLSRQRLASSTSLPTTGHAQMSSTNTVS